MATPIAKDSDSYSNFSTSSQAFPKEHIYSGDIDTLIPPYGLSQPRTIRTTNETRSIYVSRSRFFIRLFSALASVGIMGGIASAYVEYFQTNYSGLIYDGPDLWPEYIDMWPTNIMLAVGAITSFFSAGILIAGLFPKVGVTNKYDVYMRVIARRVTKIVSERKWLTGDLGSTCHTDRGSDGSRRGFDWSPAHSHRRVLSLLV